MTRSGKLAWAGSGHGLGWMGCVLVVCGQIGSSLFFSSSVSFLFAFYSVLSI
jgi:hypothetical protein